MQSSVHVPSVLRPSLIQRRRSGGVELHIPARRCLLITGEEVRSIAAWKNMKRGARCLERVEMTLKRGRIPIPRDDRRDICYRLHCPSHPYRRHILPPFHWMPSSKVKALSDALNTLKFKACIKLRQAGIRECSRGSPKTVGIVDPGGDRMRVETHTVSHVEHFHTSLHLHACLKRKRLS